MTVKDDVFWCLEALTGVGVWLFRMAVDRGLDHAEAVLQRSCRKLRKKLKRLRAIRRRWTPVLPGGPNLFTRARRNAREFKYRKRLYVREHALVWIRKNADMWLEDFVAVAEDRVHNMLAMFEGGKLPPSLCTPRYRWER